jgi:hypothetical protein
MKLLNKVAYFFSTFRKYEENHNVPIYRWQSHFMVIGWMEWASGVCVRHTLVMGSLIGMGGGSKDTKLKK